MVACWYDMPDLKLCYYTISILLQYYNCTLWHTVGNSGSLEKQEEAREYYNMLSIVIGLFCLSKTFQIYKRQVTLCKREGTGWAFL